MITDSTGRSWETSVTYATIKRVREWLVREKYWDGEKTAERTVPLAIDLLYLPDVVRAQVHPTLECELIAAWLAPQWAGKLSLSREEFDELLSPEFKESAMLELREQVNRFFTGSGGRMNLEEVNAAESEQVEMWRRRIRASLRTDSTIDGTSTPESSDLEETPTN